MKSRFPLVLAIVIIGASIVVIAAKTGRTVLQKDVAGTVDGSVTPEAIPDHVAYEFFFSSLLPRKELGDRADGPVLAKLQQLDVAESDQGTLRSIASEFKSGIATINNQVDALRKQNLQPEAPALLSKVADIQRQKQAMIEGLRDSITQRLSTEGSAKITQHINEYVKRRVKIAPPSHR